MIALINRLKYTWPLLSIFFLAFLLRLFLVHWAVGIGSVPKGEANPDQLDYEQFAFSLSRGEGYVLESGAPSARRAPGTSLSLLPIYWTFGRNLAVARVWNCFLSALCCILVGWLGQIVVSRMAGWIAALWLAIYPGHAYYAVHFLSETPTCFFLCVGLLLQVDALRQKSVSWSVFSGISWGLAVLTRPNLLVSLLLNAVLPSFFGSGGMDRRFRLLHPLIFFVAASLVMAPWIVRNWMIFGKPTFATIVPGHTFWGSYNWQTAQSSETIGYWVPTSTLVDHDHRLPLSEPENGEKAWEYGIRFIRENPGSIPLMKLHSFGRILFAYSESSNRLVDYAFRLSWLASLPFVLVGGFLLARRNWLEFLLISTPVVSLVVTTILFYGCARFRDGIAPVFAIYFAVAMVECMKKIGYKPALTESTP